MSFDGILGQDPAVRLLRDAVRLGRVGSGYLFFGPEGVGKHTAARAFAQAILCAGGAPEGAGCGECGPCVRVAAGSHPGLVEVARDEGRTRILIGQVHDLSARLALRPLEGEGAVAIIDGAEQANLEAFNALLKTLEEPPPGTTLILVTRRPDSLPDTIRSRCQAVRFRPLPRDLVEDILRRGGEVPEEEVGELAALSGGAPGRALRLFAMGWPGAAPALLAILDRERDPAVASAAIGELTAGGGEVRERTREVLSFLVELVRRRLVATEMTSAAARAATEALTSALASLDLNVGAEGVLRAALVRVLPRWRPGAGPAIPPRPV
jgi:DNA polymerase III delta' subunit